MPDVAAIVLIYAPLSEIMTGKVHHQNTLNDHSFAGIRVRFVGRRIIFSKTTRRMFMTDVSSSSAIVDVTRFDQQNAPWHCDQLERGKVLFFQPCAV